jgi:threonine synthase
VTHAGFDLVCVDCDARHDGLKVRYRCDCGGTLDVVHDLDRLRSTTPLEAFDRRLGSRRAEDRSGVWRFRELILPAPIDLLATRGEGNTGLYESEALARYAGVQRLRLKHEGENPTGSFKDRGMTVGITAARMLGMDRVACASTGNTSASMAAYAAAAGLHAVVFIPEGKIAYGKLSQALAYGALTLQIEGDFDAAMDLVERVCAIEPIYLLNSVNPFRIEGQKAIAFELLQDLEWEVPDWIVLPGGNLGNNSAISKALMELHELGLIPRLSRIAVIQAAGANPLYTAFTSGRPLVPVQRAETIATAIKIGAPISWKKSLRGLKATDGVVEEVSDEEILDAKARVDAAGIGAEPASCATIAGLRKLVARGIIAPDARVCGILTGHLLKDPDVVVRYHRGELEGFRSRHANRPLRVEADLDAILEALSSPPSEEE